jgi:hypothetical protein
MDKITKRIIERGTWAASSDLTPVNVPREGLITEIGFRAQITTAALTATAVADGLKRVIQNLKVEGDGGRTYLGLSGEQAPRLLNFMNECDHRSAFLDSLMPEVGDTALSHFSWVFHPGSNPKDPFDMSAVIPARALSTLQILLTTTANTVVDANAAIASGYYDYWINEVLDVKVPAGIMTPLGSTLTWANDANYSDYSKLIDVPGGAWLRRIVMLFQDETATVPVRKDDEVTAIKLELPRAATAVIQAKIQDLKLLTAKRYGLSGFQMLAALGAVTTRPGWEVDKVVPAGLVILDLRDYFHPIYGANLTGYQNGDVKLGLTVENRAAGDDTLIYWDQLKPVDPQYVGK